MYANHFGGIHYLLPDTLGYSQKTLQNFQAFTFSREWNIEQWWIKK